MSTPVEKLSMLPIVVHLVVSRNETCREIETKKERKTKSSVKLSNLSFVLSLSPSLHFQLQSFQHLIHCACFSFQAELWPSRFYCHSFWDSSSTCRWCCRSWLAFCWSWERKLSLSASWSSFCPAFSAGAFPLPRPAWDMGRIITMHIGPCSRTDSIAVDSRTKSQPAERWMLR